MRPYGLRRSIRCPKKYGETITERTCISAPNHDLEMECEQSEANPQKPMHEKYIRNAAVLPEPSLLLSDSAVTSQEKTSSSLRSSQPGPLLIHGFTVLEYQRTYHSVVDPLLFSACGKLTSYSLELGRTIKERLFEELAYPTFQISEQPNGEVEVLERFCVLRPTPHTDLDC